MVLVCKFPVGLLVLMLVGLRCVSSSRFASSKFFEKKI